MENTIWSKLKKMIAYVFTPAQKEVNNDPFGLVSGKKTVTLEDYVIDYPWDVDIFADTGDPASYYVNDYGCFDEKIINPATGFMMIGGIGGYDAAGYRYGFSDKNTWWS